MWQIKKLYSSILKYLKLNKLKLKSMLKNGQKLQKA